MKVGPVTTLMLPMFGGPKEGEVAGHDISRGDDVERVAIDLGHGVYALPYAQHGGDGEDAGVNVGHFHENGDWCEGGVPFVSWAGRPAWDVESWDPLTISPSVHNVACGLHGWIRQGRWEPA